MTLYLLKILVSALVILVISEVAKRNTFVAAVITSIPLTSILAFIWLHLETGDSAKLAELSSQIFWLGIPSFLFFVLFPLFLRLDFGFWPSLLGAIGMTGCFFGLCVLFFKRLGFYA